MDNGINTTVVEALILSSPEPLPGRKIIEVLSDMTPGKVGQVVAALNNRYMESGSSFRIREIAGGYQFYVIPEYAGYVQELFTRRRTMRLTRAALETLSIAAYRQPVTRAEIEHIRGVASDGVIHTLLQKNILTIKGRADTVGKPLQYGTTDEFLKMFGLGSLADLPKMSEIEELIRTKEPQDQTELPFAVPEGLGQTAQKFNIADGTYVPPSDDDEPSIGSVGSDPEKVELILDEVSEHSGTDEYASAEDASGDQDESDLADEEASIAEVPACEPSVVEDVAIEASAEEPDPEPTVETELAVGGLAVTLDESEGVIVDMDLTDKVE
ncbi:MAG: SMC-Scp complex subunit ScpB [bacterium]